MVEALVYLKEKQARITALLAEIATRVDSAEGGSGTMFLHWKKIALGVGGFFIIAGGALYVLLNS